jgi:hypothetical protein
MRFDDDHSQSFGPVLRRIAILAVIITAVPVMLWSITSFMRTFVAQPVIPSPRPIAAADTANAAPAAASSVSTPINAPVVEARATATDARSADADGKSDHLSDSAALAPTTTASLAPAPAAPTRNAPANADHAAANAPWPDPAQAIGGQQSQSAASNDNSADTPAAAPLTGPIPLPPHRPKVLAMADGPIPLPRRRPADAAATPDPPPDSGNFLTHLFGQSH